tara:strand:- start:64 stop:1683 length:1620 start_codon:yes stop_codon:yes gene_type:complete
MKYTNFKRYKFSTIFKNINFKRYSFTNFFKFLDIRRLVTKKIYKYTDIENFNFKKLIKYLNPKTYDLRGIFRINVIKSKFFLIHLPASIIFFGFLYLAMPIFYKYDKANIQNTLCKKQNIECAINGKVKYRFFPTPRIKINDIIVKDYSNKKNTFLKIKNTIIKLSFKNLLIKEKHKFKKIELNDFEINFDVKTAKKYKSIFKKNIDFLPINFTKGNILFFDKKNYIATISDANIKVRFKDNLSKTKLEGKFLNEDIHISLNNELVDKKPVTEIIFKMPSLNLYAKADLFNYTNGNILLKQGKHKFTGIIDYKDDEITIKKSNLRNTFLDGKLVGGIKIFPYFVFNLDLSLNSINFTKIYNYFISLDESKQKSFFRISKKINGNLSFSSEKIYSSYNLIKSFESRLKFNNGNILIERFLINLGKLGAADITGSIDNDKKYSNFKYESNIFVDNHKKFLSKFGIYNKKNISSNFFISGHFDFQNIRNSFYEISEEEKLNNEDIDFIEKEFNYYMLEDGYKNLFRFPKFKEFIKSITNETN